MHGNSPHRNPVWTATQSSDSTPDLNKTPTCEDWDIASEIVVILVATRNPLNIGAAARAMANFGVADLRVVNPYEVAFREAVSAVGGAHVLQSARLFESVAAAVADCSLVVGTTAAQRRELKQPFDVLAAATPAIRAHSGRVGLMFGSEKFGLSNDDLSFCHSLVRIPTGQGTPSMNLGQAVAVCLYELVGRDESIPANPVRREAIEGFDAENLTKMMLEVLDRSGYTNRITSTSTEHKVRRWIRRMRIGRQDSALMLGILRQLLWKLRE